MSTYRCYLDRGEHVPEEVDVNAADDKLALIEAERLLAHRKHHMIEVWRGARLIGRIGLRPA